MSKQTDIQASFRAFYKNISQFCFPSKPSPVFDHFKDELVKLESLVVAEVSTLEASYEPPIKIHHDHSELPVRKIRVWVKPDGISDKMWDKIVAGLIEVEALLKATSMRALHEAKPTQLNITKLTGEGLNYFIRYQYDPDFMSNSMVLFSQKEGKHARRIVGWLVEYEEGK